MKKILVTGGSGLVGQALRRCWSSFDTEMVFLSSNDGDLRSADVTRSLFSRIRPDAVIHLAAKVGGVKANMNAQADFLNDNVRINSNVLEVARMAGVDRLLAMCSTCVFPEKAELPLCEDRMHGGPPHPSNYGYAFAKRLLVEQCRAMNDQYGTHYQALIPCNLYGPFDNFNLKSSHVIPALIRKMWEAEKERRPMVVWGTGTPLREFLFSRDLAKICLQLVDSKLTEPVIVSPSIEVTIKRVVEMIAGALPFMGEITYDATQPDGQPCKPASNARLMSIFPNLRFTTLADGLDLTVRWFRENYGRLRQ